MIQSIASIRSDLKDFADISEIPKSELRQITLVVEELFSKIVRFAFEGKDQQLLEISLYQKPTGKLHLKLWLREIDLILLKPILSS